MSSAAVGCIVAAHVLQCVLQCVATQGWDLDEDEAAAVACASVVVARVTAVAACVACASVVVSMWVVRGGDGCRGPVEVAAAEVCCSLLQCVVVCCGVLQCVAIGCSVHSRIGCGGSAGEGSRSVL